MSSIERKPIQWTEQLGLSALVREINDRLRRVTIAATDTFRRSVGQVPFSSAANGTYPLFIADEPMEITGAWIRTTAGGGTVDVQANGASVTPGSPYTFTTSSVEHSITGSNRVEAGELVTLVLAGVTGSTVTSLKIRRLG